ncbi:hypothetical protein HDU76_013748 [Blyttiomyces sp. JEL0837]|nr:hypothetical protein HDU76_013748 [Blyttiomyces sp. JEL0837]
MIKEMLHHARAVARGCKSAFIVGDLPFGRVEAVKLEGGVEMADTISRICRVGIPVMGHIGLTPQRANSLGGFRVQGKTLEKAKSLLADALALQEAGCFSIVLEAIPPPVAAFITEQLDVPTIGIGAGRECSGQVLVQLDALGAYDRFVPKFCKQYANMHDQVTKALKLYGEEVRSGEFPDEEQHSYGMEKGELERFLEWKAQLTKP